MSLSLFVLGRFVYLFRFVFTLTKDIETAQDISLFRVCLHSTFHLTGLSFPQTTSEPNSRKPDLYDQMQGVNFSILIQILTSWFL